MCGIVSYAGNKDVIRRIITGLKSLEYRGYDSAGIAVIANKKTTVIKTKGRIADLEKKFEGTEPELTDFVFKFDSPKSPQQYIENVVLRGLSAHLGIVRLHPSDLQHNFVNMCLKQNIPITFVQKALGYYGLPNFIRIYKDLIANLDNGNYNPLNKILENKE